MAKTFASRGDLSVKRETFEKLADGAYCLTAEGDPNSGVIVGDDGVAIVDARATPAMARDLLRHVRRLTEKPIRYVVLSHYHAVRVLGAEGFVEPGRRPPEIVASRGTLETIRERGEEDWKSEHDRFPRLFKNAKEIPGLTWPTIVFERELTLFLGKKEIRIAHLGAGHTKGDTIVWLPREKVLYSGDLVEEGATPYCGDAQLADWPVTLDRLAALQPKILVPGRGPALTTPGASLRAIESTQRFVKELFGYARQGVKENKTLRRIYKDTYAAMLPKYRDWTIFEHCMPFCVVRAVDEAKGIAHPRIWTASRDKQMWKELTAR